MYNFPITNNNLYMSFDTVFIDTGICLVCGWWGGAWGVGGGIYVCSQSLDHYNICAYFMHRFFKGFIQMNLSFILNHGAYLLMKNASYTIPQF